MVLESFKKYEFTEIQQNVGLDKDEIDLDDDFHKHINKRSRKEHKKSGIQKYLEAEVASTKTNALEWWKVHSVEFPEVAKMAQDIMAAQATSVPVEREFSRGVDLVVHTRHLLKPSTITASMCLKSWWKHI